MKRALGFLLAASLPLFGCASTPNSPDVSESMTIQRTGRGSGEGIAEQNDVAFRPVGSQIWQPLEMHGERGGDKFGQRREGGWRDGKRWGRGRQRGYGGYDDYGYDDYDFAGYGFGPIIISYGLPWFGGLTGPWPNVVNAPLLYPQLFGGLGLGGLGFAGFPPVQQPLMQPLAL